MSLFHLSFKAMFLFQPKFLPVWCPNFMRNSKPKIGRSRLVMGHLSRLFVRTKQVSKNPRSHSTQIFLFFGVSQPARKLFVEMPVNEKLGLQASKKCCLCYSWFIVLQRLL
ncbi:hypothetical protein Droror1_Dr00013262 [Drosera rotundifolia]